MRCESDGMKKRTIWMMHDDRGEFWPEYGGSTKREVLDRVFLRMRYTWSHLYARGFRIVKVHVMKVH